MFFIHLMISIKIVLTGFLIYRIQRFTRTHRTWELCVLLGVFSLLAAVTIQGEDVLLLRHWLPSSILVFALLMAFEPELADLAHRVAQSLNPSALNKNRIALAEIARAANALSATKTGALIAFERGDSLLKFGDTGIEINADIKKELLTTLFIKDTPTHDGGLLIRKGRVTHCGAVFPLSERRRIENGLGTRHRAALGLSEKTDAVCLVVSEEEGTISLTEGGELIYGVPPKHLEGQIERLLTARDRQLYHPLHYLRRFSIKLAQPNFVHFSKSKGQSLLDLSGAIFWMSALWLGNTAAFFRLSDLAKPLPTLLDSPGLFAPLILCTFSIISLLLNHTLTVNGMSNQLKFEHRFLLFRIFQRRLSANELHQLVLRRERTGRNLQSLWLMSNKGKAIFVDRTSTRRALLEVAKKIRDALRIELVS